MILTIIVTLLCSVYFYIKDNISREVETIIHDRKLFEKHFDKPLHVLEDLGIVEFVSYPTKYRKYGNLFTFITICVVCLKVVSLV